MAKSKKPQVNGALRQWARGISFTIAMGRRQVFWLVSLHLSAQRRWGTSIVGDRHRHMRDSITSKNCLIDRGLIVAHIWNSEKLRKEAGSHTYGELWQLTRAGELVVELLKEAGIYEEVRAELEAADKPQLRIA